MFNILPLPSAALALMALTIMANVPASASRSSSSYRAGTFYGNKQKLGDGFIQTFVTVNESNEPTEVGIEADLSLFDLDSLPSRESDGANDILDEDGNVVWFCCGHEVDLQFPGQTKGLIPFDHFVMNWNPIGHIPDGGPAAGAYRFPHFDLHFYTISENERRSISAPAIEDTCNWPSGPLTPVTCEDLDFLMIPPPADQQPPLHTPPIGAVEPEMGNHLIDVTESIPFTHTFIFGIQGGDLSFWEPMITLAYFQQVADGTLASDANDGVVETNNDGTTVTVPINIPQAAPEEDFYPQSYAVSYNQNTDKIRVTLLDMTILPASSNS